MIKLIELPEKDKDIIRQAVELHGVENQIDLMIEECAELIKALLKTRRKHGKLLEEKIADVQDETADVFLMSHQIAYIFGVDEIQKRIQFKIDRAYIRNEETRKNSTNNGIT